MNEKELFKAACCNSESFETNPSVDVAFTDAITGTKQIQMLATSPEYHDFVGKYAGFEGWPVAKGIPSLFRQYMDQFHLATKGTGSVVNGYESIAGQINVELKPQESDKLIWNGYVNSSAEARMRWWPRKGQAKMGDNILLHGSVRPFEMIRTTTRFFDFRQATKPILWIDGI